MSDVMRANQAFTYAHPEGGTRLVQQGALCGPDVYEGREIYFDEVEPEEPTEGDPLTSRQRREYPDRQPEPPAEADAVDYEAMKVDDLRALCEERGLDADGKKADLLGRLSGVVEGD